MMRAARRKRPAENEEKKPEVAKPEADSPELADNDQADAVSEETVATASPATPSVSSRSATVPNAGVAATKNADSTQDPNQPSGIASESESSSISITSIAERKPDEELDQEARVARAAKNIESLASALQAYYAEKGRLPSSFTKSSSGLPTLSWRVQLLPYLGHKDLYQKFDFDKPWNLEPNKSLLQYIPDAFVSPERFDTNTNYLLPTGKKFLFGENRSPSRRAVEDGFDNTLMLFEVNDELSVPWTRPGDFAASTGDALKQGLGGLRPDSSFAIWGNGLPVLLNNSLSGDQLFRASTHEAGDGLKAGDIHQDIETTTLISSNVAKREAPRSNVVSTTSARQPTRDATHTHGEPRSSVPKSLELADAQRKLREVYAEQMRSAKERSEKQKLARQLLQDAQAIPGDPAGAYALQNAALKLAADNGLEETLISGIDQRIGMFDVDPYDENVRWLLQLKKGSEERKRSSRKLMNRVVRVACAGIGQDDYSRAANVVALAYRFTDRENEETISSLLARLRTLLSSADREFGVAVNHLDAYRKNPTDAKSAAAFGRFLCFIKGDWEKGLPLLAEHGGDTLRPIAQLDLDSAFSPADQTALGDQWWDLGERAKPGVYQQAARDRAGFWYTQAYASMPDSLDRIHVKNRLDRLAESDGASPIAACRQLADELSTDLSVELGDLGTRRSRRNSDDDDDD